MGAKSGTARLSGDLAINGGTPVFSDAKGHYVWPRVSPGLLQAIERQALRSLSDRDARGVIGEFEQCFRSFYGSRHAVAFSTGTAALHAMSLISGLEPGDEIVCCAYGFFATVSPFAFEGVKVVFCDADAFGNLSADAARAVVTERTRAVIVSHIWGNPCDMTAIVELCRERSLLLFEDCSHAHFARWKGQRVGTFGDLAAFSLNQKAITTGEGGVLLTDRDRYKDLAILYGHYHVRSRAEIPHDASYRLYSLTGMGLKQRPHTLAMAIGLQQMAIVDEIEARRRHNLARLKAAALEEGVFTPILVDAGEGEHGLYVFPFRLSDKVAFGREEVLEILAAEGAAEFDAPSSTGVMSEEPLFHRSSRHAPWDESAVTPSDRTRFPRAEQFAASLIKLPLWGYEGDEPIVERYCEVIRKVSRALAT